MKFFRLASVCSLFSLTLAFPAVSPVERDMWGPQITYPTDTTVWVAGCTYTVTWDTSDKPRQLSNPNGKIYLRHRDSTQFPPIVEGFLLTDGKVDVTVPLDSKPDTHWQVVLMGNSGDWTPEFQIVAPSSNIHCKQK